MSAAVIPRLDARDIARIVSVPQILRYEGWRLRSRNRADCGLCRGHSAGTVAYREHVWHCHRCHAGGDVYALVMQSQRCDFRAALLYVADIAGIRIDDSTSHADLREEITERQRHRDRIDRAAAALAAAEHDLWLEYRDRIHECDRVLAIPGPWSEAQWQRAQAACVLRDYYLLPTYSLLSWGSIIDRTRHILAGPPASTEMTAAIRMAGGLRTDSGYWREVLV